MVVSSHINFYNFHSRLNSGFLRRHNVSKPLQRRIFWYLLVLYVNLRFTVPMWYFFCGSFVFFVSCVSHDFASIHCCLVVVPCWERPGLLALVGDVYCIFVTFLCGILGQVWYLVVSSPDICRFWSTFLLTTVKM